MWGVHSPSICRQAAGMLVRRRSCCELSLPHTLYLGRAGVFCRLLSAGELVLSRTILFWGASSSIPLSSYRTKILPCTKSGARDSSHGVGEKSDGTGACPRLWCCPLSREDKYGQLGTLEADGHGGTIPSGVCHRQDSMSIPGQVCRTDGHRDDWGCQEVRGLPVPPAAWTPSPWPSQQHSCGQEVVIQL